MADISRQALVVGELTLASNGSRIYQRATRDKNECDGETLDFHAPHFKGRKTVEVFAPLKFLTPCAFRQDPAFSPAWPVSNRPDNKLILV
jgi:hypothetical protein